MAHHEPRARRRISVLHLIHTMAHGGVETALLNWLTHIDRERFDIHLVCFANPGQTEEPFVRAANEHGLDVDKIFWSRRKPLLKSALQLKKLLRDRNIDILHTHNCYADCVGAVVRFLTPVQTLTTLYVWSDFGWKRNLIQRVNRFAIGFADRITAHCEETYRKTLAMGFRGEKLSPRILICGFESERVEMDTVERSRRRRAMGIEDDHVVLANIARFYPEKIQDSLLRCFKEIVARRPQARLWMLGVGPLEQELKTLCTQLDLDSTVNFLGFVEDLPALLPLIDIQVHPSRMEGVPLSICAGMAAGLPIVGSDVGGMSEVLNHGDSGLLIPPGDEAGFTEAVLRLIDDPVEARRLGESARHFIENDYSLTEAVRRVEATYEEMMSLGPKSS